MSDRRIRPTPLRADAWLPFGWIPVPDTDPRDGTGRLAFDWADPHVNVIAHARAEVPATAEGLRCLSMFRHDTHTQTLMPLDHEAVIAVARAEEDFSGSESWRGVAAFVLQPLQAIVLHRGTWHWGPFPTRAESVSLFNVQGLRYREDNTEMDLGALHLDLEVLTP
jgi:ureidoglycolate hydrolase